MVKKISAREAAFHLEVDIGAAAGDSKASPTGGTVLHASTSSSMFCFHP